MRCFLGCFSTTIDCVTLDDVWFNKFSFKDGGAHMRACDVIVHA